MLRIFDGSDAVHRGHFRVISVPRLAGSKEVLVSGVGRAGAGRRQGPPVGSSSTPDPTPQDAALRAYYLTEDPGDFELQALPAVLWAGDPGARGQAQSGGALEEEGSRGPGPPESVPVADAWIIRALPRTQDVLKVYPAWLK